MAYCCPSDDGQAPTEDQVEEMENTEPQAADEEPQVQDGPEPGDEFTVTVDRTEKMTPFGAIVYSNPRPLTGVIPEIEKGTLVSETIIKPGDRILACNGASDFKEVMKKLDKDQILKIKLKRPKEYTVRINKGASLGLSLKYGTDEEYLFIDEIVEGTVAALNRKYEDRQVRVLDCIIKVNGIRDS